MSASDPKTLEIGVAQPVAEGIEAICFDDLGAERAACEAEVVASGHPLPLQHRLAWDRARGAASHFVALRRAGEGWSYAAAVDMEETRSLPLHRLLRVERLRAPRDPALFDGLLAALLLHARGMPRALRLNVELFDEEEAVRAPLATGLERAGFARAAVPRHYLHTLVLDLAAEESELLAGFNRLTRRSVRKLEKLPLEIRPIETAEYDGRMGELHAETMARTGGTIGVPDWPMLRALSKADPSLSNLVGLFRSDAEGPESLLALLWGAHHGDHVCYEIGASTRETEFNLPLSYALMWHLIRWARREGARFFDLGGVTLADPESEDPLAGISDFKRGFSKELAHVGDEWQLEVRPVRARLLDALSAAAQRLRG